MLSVIETYGPPIAAVLVASGLSWIIWTAKQFVEDVVSGKSKRRPPPPQPDSYADHMNVLAEIRAALAENQLKIREQLIDPLRAELNQLHNCIGKIRADFQVDIRAAIKPLLRDFDRHDEQLQNLKFLSALLQENQARISALEAWSRTRQP